jgi:hypothetical protein
MASLRTRRCLPSAVLEVIAQPPFLAQAAEEVEIRLVELRLEIANRVCFEQALVDRKGIVGQQLVEDLDNGLVLEDLAVGGEGGQMQPGPQRELVLDVPAFFAPHGGVGDQCIDLAHAGADVIGAGARGTGNESSGTVKLDQAADLAADEGIEIEVGGPACTQVHRIGCLEQQFVHEQAAHALVAFELDRLQSRKALDQRDGLAGDGEGLWHAQSFW